MASSINAQILNWLNGNGIEAIAVLKITGRCAVYQIKENRKGSSFIPKSVLIEVKPEVKPVAKKSRLTPAYVVSEDVYGGSAIATYQYVELLPRQLELIQEQGGMVYLDKESAIAKVEALNYPIGYGGIAPKPADFGSRSYYCPRWLDLRILVAA